MRYCKETLYCNHPSFGSAHQIEGYLCAAPDPVVSSLPMKLLAVLPFLIALSVPGFAGLATPSDEKAVLAAEKQYVDGMVKADPASVAKVLADDLSYIHSGNKNQNKAEVLADITGKKPYTDIQTKTTLVRQYGNTIVTSHEMLYFNVNGATSHVTVSMVWVKTPSGWQMVHRQATKIP